MFYDQEFDLTNSDPPPAWVEMIGPMTELWGNPVFQRRYLRWRLYPTFGTKKAFIIGLLSSLAVNIFFRFVTEPSLSIGLGFLVTIVAPIIVISAFMGMRLFTQCVVGTPLELRRELTSGMLGSLLSTPIPDSKIFYAECVAGIMRGLGALEEIVAMMVGLAIPFLIVMSPQMLEYASEVGIAMVWWIVFAVLVGMIYVVTNIMIVFAAGLYSVILPIFATIPATLLHAYAILSANILFIGFLISRLTRFEAVRNAEPLMILLPFALVLLIIMVIETRITAYCGLMAFAKARRPGFYEPERTTAAGLLRRYRERVITYGRSV